VNCKVCHEPAEDDGYGEPVHADTNRYFAADGHVARV